MTRLLITLDDLLALCRRHRERFTATRQRLASVVNPSPDPNPWRVVEAIFRDWQAPPRT